MFLDLIRVNYTAVYARVRELLDIHQKYLNLYSEDEQSYEFGSKWGWVINDRIYFFGWTIPLIYEIVQSTAHDVKKYIMATLLLK